MGKSICALLLSLLLTVALFHHAHCRRSPAKVLVAAAAANKPFKEGTNWSVGDIFVASHNEFGFPRIDVLDPEDLSVKDTYDLAQACGVHAKTRGISFSPRFSSMKLQLAVSCISDDKAGSNGNVVLVAAKHPSHPVLATLSVPQAAASTFDRSGTLYVVGVQGDQAAGTGSIQSNHFSKEPVAHLTPAKSQSHSGSIAAPPAGAAISFVEGSQQLSHRTPVVLYSFDAALHSRAMQGQQQVSRSSNTTEPFAVTTAAVMPEDAVDASDIALDLDARAAELYYTHGGSHLGTYSIIREKHLAGRPLPSTGCTAVLALFDGSVLVACSKCLYHAPADASQPVYKETCLDIEAPFGKHVAVDPEGTTLLISTTDGSLHVFSMSDFEHKLQHILLPGRTVGGIAVLGTVPANQQDCKPGTGCCPVGRLLPQGSTCRESNADCAEAATCDGESPICPENPVKAKGAVCRQPRKPCEEPATCDGVTDMCAQNSVKPAGSQCFDGWSENVCAAHGECDGFSADCPVEDGQNNGKTCAWQPDDDLNEFHRNSSAQISTMQAAMQAALPTAVQALATLVARGRRPLSQQSLTEFYSSDWAPRSSSSRARALAVCEGQCQSSKCVMTASKKGCCVLSSSRVQSDMPSDKQSQRKQRRKKRESADDLYCWD